MTQSRLARFIFFVAFGIVLLGIPLVYNASSVVADLNHGDTFLFLKSHTFRVFVAVSLCLAISRMSYRPLERLGKVFLLGSLVVLGLVLCLPDQYAPVVNGARRWLKIPGMIQVQPSEFARLALVIYLAGYLARKKTAIRDFRDGVLPAVVVYGACAVLVLAGRDLGTALTCALLVMLLLFVGGAQLRHLAALAVSGTGAFVVLILVAPYRMARVMAFLDPEVDKLGISYHVWQSLIGIARGGWVGVGWGLSRQKLLFLPEAHTDFLFSIVGEELGFIGACALIGAYALLGYLGLLTARNARDEFGRYLAIGITGMVVLNAFLHAAVTIALVPTTGLPMPLLSFGGTSIVTTMMGIGILLSVASQPRVETKGPGGMVAWSMKAGRRRRR